MNLARKLDLRVGYPVYSMMAVFLLALPASGCGSAATRRRRSRGAPRRRRRRDARRPGKWTLEAAAAPYRGVTLRTIGESLPPLEAMAKLPASSRSAPASR